MTRPNPPSLEEVLDLLREIAPLELAADWDNVGLLVAPSRARQRRCERVLLAIDATPAVVAEAVHWRADLLVAYHPPIFQPLRRLDGEAPQTAALQAALAAGLSVYSPHTALDAAPGGLADWLAEGVAGGRAPASLRPCGDGDFGRVVEFSRPLSLATLLQRCKRWLGVAQLRLARGHGGAVRGVRTVAVAAGAGGAVLRGTDADAWLTGELSHHELLAASWRGTAVILAEHTNTERGYLPVLQRRLLEAFGRELRLRIARRDRDPVAVV